MISYVNWLTSNGSAKVLKTLHLTITDHGCMDLTPIIDTKSLSSFVMGIYLYFLVQRENYIFLLTPVTNSYMQTGSFIFTVPFIRQSTSCQQFVNYLYWLESKLKKKNTLHSMSKTTDVRPRTVVTVWTKIKLDTALDLMFDKILTQIKMVKELLICS